MESLILVDSSYTSFYRFFATLRWFSLANPEEYKEHKDDPKYNWAENKIFIEKYEKMYLDSIIKVVGKKIWNNSKVIFCLDCPREEVWRNKLMDDYKGERADLSLKNNFKPTFTFTYNNIIPNIIKTNPNKVYKLKLCSAEADDIIATICKHLQEDKPEQPVYLISGDEDFLQLGRPNLWFADYKHKKPRQITVDEAKEKLHNKIILGDTSDNIPSIFPKDKKILSVKMRKELIEDKEKLEKYLEENPSVDKIYKLNQKLIDFNNIPKKYTKIIVSEFNNLFIPLV